MKRQSRRFPTTESVRIEINERGRYEMKEKNGYTIEDFDELPSTNDYAKEKRKDRRNLIVTAKRQTGGRGTKGRSFSSEEGGVYLSALTFHENLFAKEAFRIMSNAATAVCRTLSFYGVKPCIKWPNDIHVSGKKICGILIENGFSGVRVDSSVVGIGVNVYNRLPDELLSIATTLSTELGRTFSGKELEEVKERLIEEYVKGSSMEEYLSFVGYIGERIYLITQNERIPATLLSVDDEGGLLVKIGEDTKRFTAAEISVRTE